MPSQERTTNISDGRALLSMEGPIATITLNRPAAFNSVDLSIAKRLEQLGAEVEAKRHQGARDPG
jgi:enoyl-CoA hydratase/carnithine racemase